LPWKIVDGVKVYHLVAEEVAHEFAPGLSARCWGYNGKVHGPTIEAVEGDRVRIYVTNKLPEPTTVHWHGVYLPNGMDGVGGLTQRDPSGRDLPVRIDVPQARDVHSVSKDATTAPDSRIQATGEAYGEPLHRARKRASSLCFDDEMEMIALNRVMNEPRAEPLPGVPECGKHQCGERSVSKVRTPCWIFIVTCTGYR
jgi:hypothetical protein